MYRVIICFSDYRELNSKISPFHGQSPIVMGDILDLPLMLPKGVFRAVRRILQVQRELTEEK
jgi:hypothetical protein